MANLQTHLRTTLLAGVFAAVPIGVTVFLIVKVDEWTRIISKWVVGREIPFLGVLIAVVGIYLVGLFVTISLGKSILGLVDKALGRIPLLKPLYESWKQISFTPGGGEGMFAKVVLIPDESGTMQLMGFTSGDSLPNDPNTICVFVPNAPNPIQGRLYFVARSRVVFTPLGSEEAFKLLLSTGNYLPNTAPPVDVVQPK
jgi:uncharacterized membrane protein